MRSAALRAGSAALLAISASASSPLLADSAPGWTQWAGPGRDFIAPASGLANSWPEGGPKPLWRREIGGGHSAILVEGDRLYTMCRRDEDDAVLALRASDGETIWETRYASASKPDMDLTFGPGPHSTPLIVGDRIFALSATVQLHCLNKSDGTVVWKRDLMSECNAHHVGRGYGASPIAYGDTILLNLGAPDRGLVALRQSDGSEVWRSEALRPGYSSPILIRMHDEDHVVVAAGPDRIGFDPANGAIRWRYTLTDQNAGSIMATPAFVPPDLLFFTAAYGVGTEACRVTKEAGVYKAERVWHTRKMQVQHGAYVLVDGAVYASSGDFGPAFLEKLTVADGKVVWRERGFAKANVIYGDGKFIILDEKGELALALPDESGLKVVSRATVLQEKAWTAPTLVGSTLYLRDYKTILALDLGGSASSG